MIPQTTTAPMDNQPPTPKPCPNCGHCPTCGHTPPRPYYFPNPWTYPTTTPLGGWWGINTAGTTISTGGASGAVNDGAVGL